VGGGGVEGREGKKRKRYWRQQGRQNCMKSPRRVPHCLRLGDEMGVGLVTVGLGSEERIVHYHNHS